MNAATGDFIEQLGVILEAEGYPRVSGRLFGLLLLTEHPCSLDELAERLDVSKASISVNTRLLEHRGVLERVSRPGDRRDYYQVAPDLLARTMDQRLARMQRFHTVIASARQHLPVKSKVIRDRLDDLDEAYEHLLETTTAALDAWRQRRARQRARPSPRR